MLILASHHPARFAAGLEPECSDAIADHNALILTGLLFLRLRTRTAGDDVERLNEYLMRERFAV
jgi:hypothetical protein